MSRSSLVCTLLISTLLSGCAKTWEDQPPSALPGGTAMSQVAPIDGYIDGYEEQNVPVALAPAANGAGAVAPFGYSGEKAAYSYMTGYRIGAGDRLVIRVLGQSDLTNTYIVDPAGNISMPLIHTVNVAGMTSSEIERMIGRRLRKGFLRNPSVSVQVVSQRPFFILGQVNRAGSFPYQAGMTVQQAVALAGGYSPRANQGTVLLTRRNNKGTTSYQVPITTQIYPGDIVFIRERWF